MNTWIYVIDFFLGLANLALAVRRLKQRRWWGVIMNGGIALICLLGSIIYFTRQ